MKEITQYQCEMCGSTFDTASACEECENFHIIRDHVVQYKYNPKSMGPESKYPYAVVLEMEDGKQLTFKR